MAGSRKKAVRIANNVRSYASKPANVITVLFFAILVATVCFPLLSLARDAFVVHSGEIRDVGKPMGAFTLYHWKTLLFDNLYDYSVLTFWRPLLNSFTMAIVACTVAVGFGGAVAWFITRSDIPGKKFLSTIFVFPYIMPSWSIAMFWENFFKNSHIVACYNQVEANRNISSRLLRLSDFGNPAPTVATLLDSPGATLSCVDLHWGADKVCYVRKDPAGLRVHSQPARSSGFAFRCPPVRRSYRARWARTRATSTLGEKGFSM